MDLQRLEVKHLFDVKFNQENCNAAIYFFAPNFESYLSSKAFPQMLQMIFTSGYFNPEALSQMFGVTINVDEEIGFIGVISSDNKEAVRKCIEKAVKAFKNRVKAFESGGKSVEHIEAMTIEEVCEKYFPDRTETKNVERTKPEPDVFHRYPFRFLRPKSDLVDLTDCDEEVAEDNEHHSISSSAFLEACCSDSSSLISFTPKDLDIDEDMMKKLIQPPADGEKLQKFLAEVDPDLIIDPDEYQIETRTLDELSREFKKLADEVKQREKEDYVQHCDEPVIPQKQVTHRPNDSKVTQRPRTSQQSTLNSFLDKDFKAGPSTSPSFRNIRESDHGMSSNDPQLARGIDWNATPVINLTRTIKSKLLDAKDFEKLNQKHSLPSMSKPPSNQTKMSFSTQSTIPQCALPRIPKKTSQSPERHQSKSVVEKSPEFAIKSRPPIHAPRFSQPSNFGNRGSQMLQMVSKHNQSMIDPSSPCGYDPRNFLKPLGRNVNHTPPSVRTFIDDRMEVHEQEIIDVDDENNNGNRRKLLKIEPPAPPQRNYRIFTHKISKGSRGSSNQPNFGNYDGSHR